MVSVGSFKIVFFVLIIFAVLIEVVADIILKKWAIENKNSLFIFGMVVYLIGTMFWAYSLKFEVLSKAGGVFVILNLILLALAGIFIFKDELSVTNKIGIILGMISIILIEI